jgi:D-psicose/D-tagatose/L-ribulose 3-epimerase
MERSVLIWLLSLAVKKVLVVPSQVFRSDYFVTKEHDWQHSVESLRELAEYALLQGNVTILIECVNKYEVTLVRTIQDGINMAREIGCKNVKLAGDTFHMHLEEQHGIHNSIRKAGKDWLAHLHVGDNTREVPGRGCIDWKEIFIALQDINYDQAITFEPLPHRLTPEEIFNGRLDPDELDRELTFSLDYLKSIIYSID